MSLVNMDANRRSGHCRGGGGDNSFGSVTLSSDGGTGTGKQADMNRYRESASKT